jgi:D-aminopeptidase
MPGSVRDEDDGQRARLRDLGITIGRFQPGPHNAITDVTGVKVGHTTKIEGAGPLRPGIGPVRTGVTAILPRGGRECDEKCAAGVSILNGNGEMTGFVRIRETGLLETPVFLTGTANIGIVYDAALTWLFQSDAEIGRSVPVPVPVVAECWDGMGDTEGRHIDEDDVLHALRMATDGPVAEGAVGGGTGMRCYGFKAGIGTSSRNLPQEQGGYTVGVIVNANHGSRHLLRIDGVPVGRELIDYPEEEDKKSKSIILVAATDAPLLPVQLERLCRRMELGLARTGSVSTHGSGDIALAFSTAAVNGPSDGPKQMLEDRFISSLWEATVEAAEEAVLNALTAGVTMEAHGGRIIHALPLERVRELMTAYGRSLR